MSLRTRINLIIAAIIAFAVGALLVQQIEGTRRSVHEEVEAASRVATQLLARVGWIYEQSGGRGMVAFLEQLGRVRANDVVLQDVAGRVLYRSPPSTYKAGRFAPGWYAELVTPETPEHAIQLSGGRLIVRPDASRAVLDGWDDLVQLLGLGALLFVFSNGLVFWAVGRALAPLDTVLGGLTRLEGGDYAARLPPLPGREAGAMGVAFNRMAESIQDNMNARREASEATDRLARNRELTRAIQAHVEAERGQIARELHDELSQAVTGIKSLALSVEQRQRGRDEASANAAALIKETAGKAYDAMHNLVARLRPPELEFMTLGDALEDLVDDFRLRHPQVRFRLTLEAMRDDLAEAPKVAAFRIAQESLNNAVRHGSPGDVCLTCKTGTDTLFLTTTDDGSGLPQNGAPPTGGFGLAGMRERAEALGGSLAIEPNSPRGVTIRATMPIAAASANPQSTS